MTETRYAQSGDLSIAYRVIGDGPMDLMIAPGFVSNVEALAEWPEANRALERLASFSRLIVFDKREQGLSDRVGRPPTIEEMVDDMVAVLDAVGSERTAVLGISEGGAMALMFAASHPERCTHLAVWSGFARMAVAPDYPDGVAPETLRGLGDVMQRGWGGPVAINLWAPSRVGDAETERQWAHLLRTGTSPKSAAALIELYEDLDVRHALPLVSAPTLILHRAEDRAVQPAMGRYIADHINGARFVEVPGADHVLWTQGTDAILDEIEEFITGTRQARAPERVLATVMFTDIVGSTGHLARLGDQRWKEVLDRHDDAVRRSVGRFQGRVVQTTGDGVLATFDGPARAIQCALRIKAEIAGLGIEIRAGLHTGECELRGADVGGMAVHIGARVAALAGAGEVLVSSTVKDLVVGSGIEFDDRGVADLKGVPGEWHLYAVNTGT